MWAYDLVFKKCRLCNSVGVCIGPVMVFVGTIREILGVCVGGGHFLAFIDGLFFLGLYQSGCLWVFVNITLQAVGVCKGHLYGI